MSDKKPYWWPELIDEAFFARLRKDYPENAHMSDEELAEYYEVAGQKYADCWDHVGDARGDWEPLADAYLALRAACKDLLGAVYIGEGKVVAPTAIVPALRKITAAMRFDGDRDE
jgi:hypothetical protein